MNTDDDVYLENFKLATSIGEIETARISAENRAARFEAYIKRSITSQGHTLGCQCDHGECVDRRETLGTPDWVPA